MGKKSKFERTMQALRADLKVQTKMDTWTKQARRRGGNTGLQEYF